MACTPAKAEVQGNEVHHLWFWAPAFAGARSGPG
jgi:hypothetical protein